MILKYQVKFKYFPFLSFHRKMSQILVKVVRAHNTNLHLKNLDTGESTKIMAADELVLTKFLVDHVIENGKQSTRKQWGYSSVTHFQVQYVNEVYTLIMSPEEILNLLKVTPRNRHSSAYKRILEVLGREDLLEAG